MNKDRSAEPKKKKDTNQAMIIISLMITAILFLADFYIIINNPGNYVALAGITLLLLVWVYLFINSILREINKDALVLPESDQPEEENRTDEWQQNQIQYFAELIKSEKASYILLKKVFNQISNIEADTKVPSEDIIAAQKAIAKVTISRNKENSDAIMNSNDKVMERMFAFEEKIDENNQQLLEEQREVLDASARGMMEGQQELAAGIRELESSIQNELLKVSGAIDSLYEKMVTYTSETTEEVMKLREEMESYISIGNTGNIPQMNQVSQIDQFEKPDNETEIGEMAFQDEETIIGAMAMTDEEPELDDLPLLDEEPELDDLPLLDEEPELDDLPLLDEEPEVGDLPLLDEEPELGDLPLLDEEPELKDLPLLDEEPELGDLPLLDEIPGLDDIRGLDEELEADDLPLTDEEPELSDLSILDEFPMLNDESEVIEVDEALEAEEEPVKEEELQAEEPIKEEELQEEEYIKAPAVEIDMSNPNKMLTPEEIAALVAGTAGNAPETESVKEKKPQKQEMPVKEDKPIEKEPEKEDKAVMPELSNPSKLMTPEEIAALIANM